jgi:surface antigen
LQRGQVALNGQEEYLPSHLFNAADEDRWMIVKGTLITVFDPKASDGSKVVWEWKDEKNYGIVQVTKGFRVSVLNGYVKMSTSAPD